MEQAIDTIKYRDHVINIYSDEDSENPREWDNLGTMVCFHRRYNLGDKHDFANPDDFRQWAKDKNLIVLPLWLYSHGGLRIKVGNFVGLLPQGHARFDTMQIGWIYVEQVKARKEYNWKIITTNRQRTLVNQLKGEVEIYDRYLSGQVCCYSIEGQFSNDSCGGFYKLDDAIIEAKDSIDWEIDQAVKKHNKQVKTWIKNKVPLQNRAALNMA